MDNGYINFALNEDTLRQKLKGKNFYFFEECTSTFDVAKDILQKDNTLICARRQTQGRGRLGRQWESKMGGIYFSLILKPVIPMEKVASLTSLCAVGVQRAIERFIPCRIKWPNDIVSQDGRKLCGILTKLETSGSDSYYINVGVGINANTSGFASELKHAVSISELLNSYVDENELLSACIEEIEKCCDLKNSPQVMEEYRQKCVTYNTKIKILYINEDRFDFAFCKDIRDDGTLLVVKDNGEELKLSSGEVSVRGIYGEEYV